MKKGQELEIDIVGIEFPNKPYGIFEDRKIYPQGNFLIGSRIKGIISKIRNKKAEVLMKEHQIKKIHLALFSRYGFTPDVEAKSKNEGIRLFTADSIVNRV